MGLTAKRVAKLLRAGKRGRHFDGHGLNLIITGKGTGNWQRRYELHGKGHWMGLGSTHARTLAEARLRNREVSQQLEDGVDPLAARSAAKAALLATAATKLTKRAPPVISGRSSRRSANDSLISACVIR